MMSIFFPCLEGMPNNVKFTFDVGDTNKRALSKTNRFGYRNTIAYSSHGEQIFTH